MVKSIISVAKDILVSRKDDTSSMYAGRNPSLR